MTPGIIISRLILMFISSRVAVPGAQRVTNVCIHSRNCCEEKNFDGRDQLHPQWHHNAFMTFEKVPDQMFLPCSIKCPIRCSYHAPFARRVCGVYCCTILCYGSRVVQVS
ncbi:hypothetical protein Hanom_Chr16g01520821 [Helianthus anomalus]